MRGGRRGGPAASAMRTPDGDDVVDHPGELSTPKTVDRAADAQAGADHSKPVDRAGAEVGPHDMASSRRGRRGSRRAAAPDGATAGADAGRRRARRPAGRQVGDRGADHNLLDLTGLVVTGQQRGSDGMSVPSSATVPLVLVLAQFGGGVTRCRGPCRLGHVGDAYCRCSLCTHGCTGYASRRQASCPVSPIVIMRAFRPVGGADVAAPNLET